MKLFIHAVNIHQGGGYSLLSALLCAVPEHISVVALLDSRMPVPVQPPNLQIKRVVPSVRQRFAAERWLRDQATADDIVLCFGNLPPLYRLKAHTSVFLQNRYLVEHEALKGFPLKTKLRLEVERKWLKRRGWYADRIIVQTPTMKAAFRSSGVAPGVPLMIIPFVQNANGYRRALVSKTARLEGEQRFLYVASGEPHKNHRRLVEAWRLLADEGLFPSLLLTIDSRMSDELCEWIETRKGQHGLRIENLGVLSHAQIREQYAQVSALLYPSLFESFGLPLIEARQANLPVIASELDYVRDLLDPEQSFNPQSARSIARAVKRFMGIGDAPLPLLGAHDFISRILAM
jgi:glycosyltransferase involved in cell wall biosynthesis